MADWAVIKDDKIINIIIADTKEIAESVTGLEVIEAPKWWRIGLVRTPDGWRDPYPTDGKDYIWSNEWNIWCEIVDEEV